MKERLQAQIRTLNKDIKLMKSRGYDESNVVVQQYQAQIAAIKQALKHLTCSD